MTHSKIYRTLLDLIYKEPKSRKELIESAAKHLYGVDAYEKGEIGRASAIRAEIGEVLNEMEESGVISSFNEKYAPTSSRPVALRMENCEKEILKLLRTGPKTKAEIRKHLENHFGTNRTPGLRDDNILFTLNGQVLKRLTKNGIIHLTENRYEVSSESQAMLDDIDAMLGLKSEFLTRLHSKGGEFFEHYIMTLLEKYMTKNKKTVVSNRTLGGSNDGGIDGIIQTVDCFGFRETIMVQAKNRMEPTNETTARSFYGAVCAARGTRGIFACTSDFHSSARDFLQSIDNCVGVNGSKIFEMAIECQYGLKRKKGHYVIDNKIL